VVQKLLRKARKGTRVIYVPGNHDEPLRDYDGMGFGDVLMMNETIHVTADGKRLLVAHGDAFDGIVKYARGWPSWATMPMLVPAPQPLVQPCALALGYPYWSLSAFLKTRVKDAVKFISDFEHAMAEEAKRRGLDGVVCGHIHKAEIKTIDGMLYCNDGDWVESCTALVEHRDGRLEIIEWAAKRSSPCWRPISASQRRARAARLRLALVTDAWAPQVNGVVRTLQRTKAELERSAPGRDHLARPVPQHSLPDLSGDPPGLSAVAQAERQLDALKPMPSTSRPKGRSAGRARLVPEARLPFTTAYHTKFPEYVAARFSVPLAWTYGIMRRFHAPATRVMVATQSIEDD
jgi:UDP-2,3-diacylglucosamine pyrophosphatase LpxH